jgi:hypothetical protein
MGIRDGPKLNEMPDDDYAHLQHAAGLHATDVKRRSVFSSNRRSGNFIKSV